ncbi:TetR/AcrR family transcriptional regulator [Nocardioides speluncae]|uniref:TetR/AcrR family transcriptional regulator n=1 Tax=Nocardioides speluncae TaxID=2670337 RepID=UPI00137AF69E|nr:TetR/AcrR family transcriptional regulator [Nocardioides speluncae]
MPTPQEYRELILDAAVECLTERPVGARFIVHIAQKAGVSKPTVYKYGGDQQQILHAVLAREVDRYLQALRPEFAHRLPLAEHFTTLVVFSVGYLRHHRLLQAMLTNDPGTVTKALTIDLEPLLKAGLPASVPLLRKALGTDPNQRIPTETVMEWGIRLSLSMALTASPLVDLEDPDAVRAHVHGLFTIGATSTSSAR